jgi:hypothetical protein
MSLGRSNPRRAIMAMQIVMDRTGDSRHHFDPNDAQDVAMAEWRFYELTNVGFTAAARTRPEGLADPIVRSERGRNRVLSQAGRRLIGPRHAAF